jgi:hypothetical protein
VAGSVAAGAAGVSVVVTSADGSAVAVASARALEQKANTSEATRMAKPQRRKRLAGPLLSSTDDICFLSTSLCAESGA